MAFLKPLSSKRTGRKWFQFLIVALIAGGGLILVYKLLPSPEPQEKPAKTEGGLPKIVEEGTKAPEGLPPQGGGPEEKPKPSEEKKEEKSQTTATATLTAKGFIIKYPSDWKVKEKDAPAAAGQTYTTLESKDFTQEVDQTTDIPKTSVKKGASLSISRQELGEKNFIKDFDTLKEFWKLGRGGHFVKAEKEIKVANQRALFHTLGDLKEGSLIDVHFLTADNKINYDISWSYNNQDYSGDYGELFNQLLASFNLSS